jgi:hypothetical protein
MTPTRCLLASTIVVLGLAMSSTGRAEQDEDPTALAAALMHVTLPLQDGLRASQARGLPISGKYEIEDGALQLSVYTTDGKTFHEVIVDHKTAQIAKADELSKADDVAAANDQVTVMAFVKTSLATAADKAEQANDGYRAIGVTPVFKGGRGIAAVTLLRGTTLKTVEQPMD